MIQVEPKLLERLIGQGIGVEPIDEETLILKAVPVHPNFFNKEKTNVLVRHFKHVNKYLICVDDDLEFMGEDRHFWRIFKTNQAQNGWRPMYLQNIRVRTPSDVICQTMEMLWLGDNHPVVNQKNQTPEPESQKQKALAGILKDYAIDLSEKAEAKKLPPTVGREREIELAVATLNKWEHPRLPIVTSDAGVGRTNFLYGLTNKFLSMNNDPRVLLIALPNLIAGCIFPAEREEWLKRLFKEMAELPDVIFAVEDIDLILTSCGCGTILFKDILDTGLRIIGTVRTDFANVFSDPTVSRRVQWIYLSEPDAAEALEILQALKCNLEEHHSVQIPEATLEFCVKRAEALPGRFP
ncbi:MAG: hypothetical protein ACE5NG_14900, partial [bacterium]